MRKLLAVLPILFVFVSIWLGQSQPIAATSITSPLVISEIMPDPTGNDSLYEWIELHNSGNSTINLSDYKIGTTTLPNSQLLAQEYVVLAKDIANFNSKYTTNSQVLAFSFSLANSGGSLLLKDAAGNELQNFSYGQSTEEKSFELLEGTCSLIQINSNGNSVGSKNNLCPGSSIGLTASPSPTSSTVLPTVAASEYSSLVIISRAYPNPETGDEWLELSNLDNINVNLAEWTIADRSDNKYTIPTVILQPGESFKIFPTQVSLNNDGDTIFLYNPNQEQVDVFSYAKSMKGQIFAVGEFVDPVVEVTPTATATSQQSTSTLPLKSAAKEAEQEKVKFGTPRLYRLL